ncbi:hypothetical protein ACEUAP_03455 [Aeromonas veronii]
MKVHPFPTTPSTQDRISKVGGPGDGGGDDVLEPRVAKLESHVEHIQRDTTDIKQKLERVADDANEIKITLVEMKAKQDTFSTKEQLAEIATKQDSFATKAQISELAVSTKEQVSELAASTKAQISELTASTKERFGEVSVTLAEIKARQETFATKEALQEVKTAVQSSANKVILAMFTIAALLFGAMRLFPAAPAPIQPQTSGAVVEQATVAEAKK